MKYGIKEMAQSEVWMITVTEDVKTGMSVRQETRTYMGFFVDAGKQPLVLLSLGPSPTTALASPQLREDFLVRRRTGELPEVGSSGLVGATAFGETPDEPAVPSATVHVLSDEDDLEDYETV